MLRWYFGAGEGGRGGRCGECMGKGARWCGCAVTGISGAARDKGD